MASHDNNSRIDYGLVLTLMLFCIVSLVSIYTANHSFVLKQALFYMIGVGLIALVIRLDSEQLKKISWYGYGLGILLLVLLMIAPASIAPVIKGAKTGSCFRSSVRSNRRNS
jgi:rod shape determining protein RodA